MYLVESVKSVFWQQCEFDLQVIIVDDGSTDDTQEVCEIISKRFNVEYREREWPGVKSDLEIYRTENQGVAKACEYGLEKCKGEYVLRLDADDILPLTYIQKLYQCLADTDSHIAYSYCDAHCFGANDEVKKAIPFNIRKLLQENYIHVSSLIKMDALKSLGQYYNANMQYGLEDWDLYLAFLEKGMIGQYCEGTYLMYRQKEDCSRNQMGAKRNREMRKQAYQNHPKIFNNISGFLTVWSWKAARRLKKIGGACC